jgi:hypothetical protein
MNNSPLISVSILASKAEKYLKAKMHTNMLWKYSQSKERMV